MRLGWLWPAGLATLVALGWILWRTKFGWVPTALVALSPIALATVGQAAWHLLRPRPAAFAQPAWGNSALIANRGFI